MRTRPIIFAVLSATLAGCSTCMGGNEDVPSPVAEEPDGGIVMDPGGAELSKLFAQGGTLDTDGDGLTDLEVNISGRILTMRTLDGPRVISESVYEDGRLIAEKRDDNGNGKTDHSYSAVLTDQGLVESWLVDTDHDGVMDFEHELKTASRGKVLSTLRRLKAGRWIDDFAEVRPEYEKRCERAPDPVGPPAEENPADFGVCELFPGVETFIDGHPVPPRNANVGAADWERLLANSAVFVFKAGPFKRDGCSVDQVNMLRTALADVQVKARRCLGVVNKGLESALSKVIRDESHPVRIACRPDLVEGKNALGLTCSRATFALQNMLLAPIALTTKDRAFETLLHELIHLTKRPHDYPDGAVRGREADGAHADAVYACGRYCSGFNVKNEGVGACAPADGIRADTGPSSDITFDCARCASEDKRVLCGRKTSPTPTHHPFECIPGLMMCRDDDREFVAAKCLASYAAFCDHSPVLGEQLTFEVLREYNAAGACVDSCGAPGNPPVLHGHDHYCRDIEDRVPYSNGCLELLGGHLEMLRAIADGRL